MMPQYINADIISRADTASVSTAAQKASANHMPCVMRALRALHKESSRLCGAPPYEKNRSIHPVDDPSGFLYKGFVRVKFVVPYFFCTYLRQSRVTAARMMIPSNMN